ncbi:caspase family protein [Pseudahrensia aquimaris]|uniref:Caspase family protein n=1 Tax=Pseudahrensia aquimaris TaxID=744461 RepID=A0ABW3FDB7_9HYPH
MMKLWISGALALMMIGQVTMAQGSNWRQWTATENLGAAGVEVCDGQYGSACLRVWCDPDSGLVAGPHSSSSLFKGTSSVGVLVDGVRKASLNIGTFQDSTSLATKQGDNLLNALAGGRRAALVANGTTYGLTLRGSGKALNKLRGQCVALRERLTSGKDLFNGERARYNLLKNDSFPSREEGKDFTWKRYDNSDIPGGDIASGQSDPLLRNLSALQCREMCRVEGECFRYTHYRGFCTLKRQMSNAFLKSFRGATSGEWSGTKDMLQPPPSSGPGPIADGAVVWRSDDDAATHVKRIRDASRRLGAACSLEEAQLRAFNKGVGWSIEKSKGIRVGRTYSMRHTGGDLKTRIPVWIVASSDKPMRFSGRGIIALGPDAPNPFGIKAGQGRHRALIALASRGSSSEGSFEYAPLEAGPVDFRTELVAYLRACDRETSLSIAQQTYDVLPGPARIVLNTAESRAAYTQRIALPKMQREILLNATRLLVRDTTSGTEIVERAGQNLQISPTHRFAAVEQDDKTEIVDVFDGSTVAKIAVGEIYWTAGDSFVLAMRAPWGKIDIASTFGDHLEVKDQTTGPSCCLPEDGSTHVSIDLENAAFAIVGNFGHRIGALANPTYSVGSNSSGAYSSDENGSVALHYRTFASLGTVAPISLTRRFNGPGGLIQTSEYEDIHEPEGEGRKRPIETQLKRRLDRVGLRAESLEVEPMIMADAGNSIALREALPLQLARLGVELKTMEPGERLLRPETRPGYEAEAYVAGTADNVARSTPIMRRFMNEAASAGWKVTPATIGEFGTLPECYHLAFDDDHESSDNRSRVPFDVQTVSRVETAIGSAWIAQARCTAGATFGSLRDYSSVYLMDFAGPPPVGKKAFLLDASFSFENNYQGAWHDGTMRLKADDERLLTYSPGTGTITLWNRRERSLLFRNELLPDGDLLMEAWLTSDAKHIVQLNRDGNFYIHVVNKVLSPNILSGRLVDDEIAVWNRDYAYEATAEAATLIDLRFPGRSRQYSLDRFGAALRVKGLTHATLQGQPQTDLPSAAVLPIPPSLDGKIVLQHQGTVMAELTFDQVRTRWIDVFQDGVRTDRLEAAEISGRRIFFERLKDARIATIVASDANGLASLPISTDLGSGTTGTSGRRRALAVGVNTYENAGIPSINFALRDAGLLLETLAGFEAPDAQAPSFETLAALKDRRATPDAILDATRKLLDGLDKGDHAVIFFAGHGMQDETGRFYLATSNSDPANLRDTALPFDKLREVLSATRARITILLDACHSGAAGAGLFITNDALVTDLARTATNITVLAASKGRQVSIESNSAGGGYFSNAIADVISGDRVRFDTDRNGRIEASELYRGVKRHVMDASGGLQTPWVVRSRMVGDYALF